MGIEGSENHGSMFGVVDSINNLARALEKLLQFLPSEFVWPTIISASPYSATAEWGRDNASEEMTEAVWLHANPDGVKMNANFRQGWPDVDPSDFDAQIAAGWLSQLTKNWKWDAQQSNGHISSTLRRNPMGAK